MKTIYFSIVILSLFSDLLLKGYLPGSLALMIQYALAVVILFSILKVNINKNNNLNRQFALPISFFIFFLIFNYVIQMLIAYEVPILHSVTHMAYISIPLLFVLTVLWRSPDFDLVKLAHIFLIMMIPINLVGIIQYYIDSSFLISHAYSESGGIVLRNYNLGAFSRYPSIFVSSDRYSAIGLMQLYFGVVLLSLSRKRSLNFFIWVNFNLASGFMAILISGARSRIFIMLAIMFMMALSFLVFRYSRKMTQKVFNASLASLLVVLAAGVVLFMNPPKFSSKMLDFPVVDLLVSSIEENKTEKRLLRYVSRTSLSEDISFFGKGLGSLGYGGKPSEIGIESIWVESGVIGGALILIGYFGFISVLAFLAIKAFIGGQALGVCIFGLPVLALLGGLLTGLTSVFEFSSGILLMIAIGANLQRISKINLTASLMDQPEYIVPIKTGYEK